MVADLLKRPTGFFPLVISIAFLVPMAVGIARGTLLPQPDEGIGAHLFQLFMPLQLVAIAWFAALWLPKRPRSAAPVLVLQSAGFLAVLAIVYFRHL